MSINRKPTQVIEAGSLKIGGLHSISIQSMTNTDTADVSATVSQIRRLEEAGCELVRVAVPNREAADALSEIKKAISIPLAADIHFDYRLALLALEQGVDKLRLNPGNIGGSDRVRQVAEKAKERGIPIRVGVNAGSLEKDILAAHGGVTAQGLVESALRHVALLEQLDFYNIVVSIKASSVPLSLAAYRLLSARVSYPLHIGITESGTLYGGSIKSAAGIGALLAEGIGDTLRVSLTGDPVEEIRCAKEILKALELRKFGVELISCPTCGRTEVDLISLANRIETRCRDIKKDVKIAVMGCAVNGPGEAREADLGVACGKGCGLIFKKGEIIRKVPEDQLEEVFMEEVYKL